MPTTAPTGTPTNAPTHAPTTAPSYAPTTAPTSTPTDSPTNVQTFVPTTVPTGTPTNAPTHAPTTAPTSAPTTAPTGTPTDSPTNVPTTAPTGTPTNVPTHAPTLAPTSTPTDSPTNVPTFVPTTAPTPTATSSASVETILTMRVQNIPPCETQKQMANNIEDGLSDTICGRISSSSPNSCVVECQTIGPCSQSNRSLLAQTEQRRYLQDEEISFLIIVTRYTSESLSPSDLEAFENVVQASVKNLEVATIICGEVQPKSINDPFVPDMCNTHSMEQGKSKKMKSRAQTKSPRGTKGPKQVSKQKAQNKSPQTKGPQNSSKNDKGYTKSPRSRNPKTGL